MATKTPNTSKNTNLFYQLYSTPNDYATSGFVCSSAVDEKDTSFDISGSTGEITDSNGDTLSSIDLSLIHSDGISEYYTETKILGPQSAYLLQGNVTGDTYSAQFFKMYDEISKQEGYDSFINASFIIHYTNCDEIKCIQIDTQKLRTEPGDVCAIIQAELNKQTIPVSVSIKNLELCDCEHTSCPATTADFLVFQSTEEGYSFYVHSLYVTAIEANYINYDKSPADYSETPFINSNIDFNYIINLIKTEKPLLIGNVEQDYTKVPCDIYRYFVNIAPMAIYEQCTFADNVKKLEHFEECFNADGTIKDDKETLFVKYSHSYPDVYAYYWGNDRSIMNKYNIHSIIAMLNTIAFYAFDSNVHGPYELEESVERRIYNLKYPNGAFRGLVLIPDWSSASDEYSVLKLNHVADYVNIDEKIQIPEDMHVEGFVCNECVDVYRKVKAQVKVNTLLQSEYEIYKSCNCNPVRKVVSNESMNKCINSVWTYDLHDWVSNESSWTSDSDYQDINNIWSDSNVAGSSVNVEPIDYIDETEAMYKFLDFIPGRHKPEDKKSENTIGLYRYMQHLNDNDMWTKVGDAYMVIGAKDDYQSKIKNLQNSVLIYNPNNVPVRIKFMVFS